MEDFRHILLFKTDIRCDGDKQRVGPMLDNDPAIERWTVDTDDTDGVLRVISYSCTPQQIIELIKNHGFTCCELT